MTTRIWRGVWGAALLALVLAGPARAQEDAGWGSGPATGRTESSEQLRETAQLVVSERLRTYALAHGLASGGPDLGTALDLKTLLERQGFYLEGKGFHRIDAAQALYPTLSYVPNFNGGAPQDKLTLAGLTFTLREDLRARDAWAAGLGYDGLVRFGWSEGRYIEMRGQVAGMRALSEDMTQRRGRVSVCSRNHVAGWTFVDGCLVHAENHRVLSDVTQDLVELSASHLFERGQTRHELGAALLRAWQEDRRRDMVELTLDSVWRRDATRLTFDVTTPAEDEDGLALGLSGDIRWRIAGRVAGVGLSVSRSARTWFLGQERIDRGIGVSGLLQISRDLSMTVALSRIDSSVDFFDDRQLAVNFSYQFP
ncbi:hypothetical protein KM176_14195 [Pseudooceanicola sp. CBS1P-1]|uniref:DUF2219 family protein n=1 Tax=Pseudooceanicola albus TaxID=2692189 RepID=A0A6L7G3A3_9RHOB|nr:MULTISPECIES: hypothetical protein [Pseudooceanicola]MBT9385018.1 hypothetical protein [Pseudooceanicola endophyticus]MXN17988.1 hypothetical protein [Pseudooceanicola albus]